VSSSTSDFQYRHSRQTHAGLIPKLMTFAFENFGQELVNEAWKDFNDDDSEEHYQPGSPMEPLFMPWFLFNWIVELRFPPANQYRETTVAELFLHHHGNSINSAEHSLLHAANRCPYTLCEVVEVKSGIGITLFDLLRRIRYEVVERTGSHIVRRGEIIYCATTNDNGFRSNIATGPYALRPTAKREVLDLRKWILEQIDNLEITTQHLHEFEYDIRVLYLDLLKGMFTPPTLVNTDGDPMLPQKLYFDIKSADKAFHALKDLEEGRDENDLLKDSTVKNGLVTRAEIAWLGGSYEARKRLAGPVLLGLLKIDEKRLLIEVNSTRRAELIRNLVEERLGEAGTYKTTLIEPIESQVQEMWRTASVAGPESSSTGQSHSSETGLISLHDAPPELRAMMEETARQHWESWFDLPIPALDDMTPRDAAKTEEGRDMLESLLLLYENQAEVSADELFKPDVLALRRRLGMD
jgi:hypothetical protein